MDNIIEPDSTFDFETLSLAHPVGIQGGAYFTRIEHCKKPLYIQTLKSITRQGFVKTGKRFYCDLMFDKNAEELVTWFENLEERCHKLIYDKKDAWFQGNLEESDIETAFNPIIRMYKSGKYYLLRTNIKTSKDDQPLIKIYNEQHENIPFESITPESELISIVEIQGIKFTSRNFQIELELKQSMVMDTKPILFENCLIKPSKREQKANTLSNVIPSNIMVPDGIEKNIVVPDVVAPNIVVPDVIAPEVLDSTSTSVNESLEELFLFEESPKFNKEESRIDTEEHIEVKDPIIEDISNKNNKNNGETSNSLDDDSNMSISFEEISPNIEENNPDELKEVDNEELFALDKKQDAITLKKPNQVYFELYKEARSKAKQAKRNAILAYLEAKNIKKTYMIENINDSDSDFDAEIDDVSESELDDL